MKILILESLLNQENFIDLVKTHPFHQNRVIEVLKENELFVTPQEDFILLTNIHGKEILNILDFHESIGIFSSIDGNGFLQVAFEDNLICLKSNQNFFDCIYYCGGAFFKKSIFKNQKEYEGINSFLVEHLKDLSMAHRGENIKPALFLDRDGVINYDCGYPSQISEIKIYQEIIPIIKSANERSWPVIVLTNQSGLARGFLTREELDHIHRYMNTELNKFSAHIDEFYYCPYYEKGPISTYAKNSLLRKPYPLLAIQAGEKYQINYSKSIMIGDKFSDKLYGLNIKTLLLKSKYIINEEVSGTNVFVFQNHAEIYQHLQKNYFL